MSEDDDELDELDGLSTVVEDEDEDESLDVDDDELDGADDEDDEDIDDMMRMNVKSALYGMQEVLPHFISRGRGHVINVSSMLGRVPMAVFRSAYNGLYW